MSRDPADISGAPEDIIRAQIEDLLGGGIRAHHVASGGVDDSLRFAGCAGSVKDIENVFTVAGNRLTPLIGFLNEAMIPTIASFFDTQGEIAALDDHDVFDARRILDGIVRIVLQGNNLAATITAVRGDEHLGAGIVNAVAQRLGTESAKDNGVYRADARARKHGDHCFRNHRQVDGHPVALLHPE